MSDVTRVAPDAETPVNPYSLLEAVNNSSDTAHTAWLIFLAIMTYLMVTVAGVTHKALLLETAVPLPLLQVSIPLTQFFQFAPVILVLFHLGVVAQLVMLARKTIEFDQAIRLLEATDRRTHPLRLELNNFFFVQAVAGPHRSLVMSAFLHLMSWLTLVILPVLLLLYIQVVFLPYHDETITWTQRIALVADTLILVLIGVFLMRAESSFPQAFLRTTTSHPLSFLMTGSVLGLVVMFSLMVATIPDERLDRVMQKVWPHARDVTTARDGRRVAGFNVPFLKPREDGSFLGFHRSLVVTDTDLVVDKDVTSDEPSIVLRGRDLRHARLDRSDLHQADLTGANLSDASLVGTDLRKAFMGCASLDDLILSDNREAGRCVTARRANLKRARLQEASLAGIDLTGAVLEEARLDGAELAYALLAAANFSSAHLERADLGGGVQAQGANFLVAALQGADLTGAQLQGADFSSAAMQGALLSHAQLHGATLRDVDLEGGDLYQARLHGADMSGARLRAVDLRGAAVWMAVPPAQDAMALSDFSEIVVRPMAETEALALRRAVERVPAGTQRERVAAALAPTLQLADSRRWAGTADQLRWDSMIKASAAAVGDGYRGQLTEYLGRLACRARWSNGAVATGVARRAMTQQYRGDQVATHDRLRGADCPGGQRIPPRILRELTQAADVARSN